MCHWKRARVLLGAGHLGTNYGKRRSRLNRSRSEVSSLIRSNHGAMREREPVFLDRESPITLCLSRGHAHMPFSYCRSFGPSSPMATPETCPANSPTFVKSTGALESLNNTADTVEFNVRVPDAPLKRPVPPVIL
jgi:hypothetical protein